MVLSLVKTRYSISWTWEQNCTCCVTGLGKICSRPRTSSNSYTIGIPNSGNFQQLIGSILHPHSSYAYAYLDDISYAFLIMTRINMQYVQGVLKSSMWASLTASPEKCAVRQVAVRCLGCHLGHVQVHTQIFTKVFRPCQPTDWLH